MIASALRSGGAGAGRLLHPAVAPTGAVMRSRRGIEKHRKVAIRLHAPTAIEPRQACGRGSPGNARAVRIDPSDGRCVGPRRGCWRWPCISRWSAAVWLGFRRSRASSRGCAMPSSWRCSRGRRARNRRTRDQHGQHEQASRAARPRQRTRSRPRPRARPRSRTRPRTRTRHVQRSRSRGAITPPRERGRSQARADVPRSRSVPAPRRSTSISLPTPSPRSPTPPVLAHPPPPSTPPRFTAPSPATARMHIRNKSPVTVGSDLTQPGQRARRIG